MSDSNHPSSGRFDDVLVKVHERLIGVDSSSSPEMAELNEHEIQRLSQMQECLALLERVRLAGDSTVETAGCRTHDWLGPAYASITESSEELPPCMGRFEIERRLGGGGQGVVFLAYDPLLKRRVALKVPRPETLIVRELRERFLREAQVAAQLSHQFLIQVYEVGEAGPLCFIASAYCSGPSLAQWIAGRPEPPPVEQAASLVARLAQAVEHIHTRRVLHRDIKPSNVLLDPPADAALLDVGSDAEPLEKFTPKLTDFGLAKLLELDAGRTRSGTPIGTPAYMAPEQARGAKNQIGPATDVYGLGAILYELLTHQKPFEDKSEAECLQWVLTAEPVSPRRIRSAIPRDLEAICLKCLEKDPQRRYATAGELAADLGRFLAGEPTVARPLSAAGRALRWSARNRRVAALLAAVTILLASVTVISSISAYRINLARRDAEQSATLAVQRATEERAARDDAERARDELQQTLSKLAHSEAEINDHMYPQQFELAHKAYVAEDFVNAKRTLEKIRAASPHSLTFEWHWLWDRIGGYAKSLPSDANEIFAVNYTPDGRYLVAGTADGVLLVWDAVTHIPMHRIQAHTSCINRIAFSPDGSLATTASCDRTVSLWKTDSWQPVTKLVGHHFAVYTCAFSPDGKTLATGTHRQNHDADEPAEFRLWDLSTKGCIAEWRAEPTQNTGLAFIDGGRTLVAGFRDGAILQWDVTARPPVPTELRFPLVSPPFRGAARLSIACGNRIVTSSDSEHLIYVAGDTDPSEVVLVDLIKNQSSPFAKGRFPGDLGTFSPDGRRLVLLKNNRTLQMHEVPAGRLIATFLGRSLWVHSVAFSPNGRYLATGNSDRAMRIYDLSLACGIHHRIDARPDEVGFDVDRQLIYFCTDRNKLEFRDVVSGQRVEQIEPLDGDTFVSATLSPDGRWACCHQFHDDSDSLVLADLRHQQTVRHIGLGHVRPAFSEDSRYLAISNVHGIGLVELASVRLVWETALPENFLKDTTSRALQFSPDGRSLTLTSGGSRPCLMLGAEKGGIDFFGDAVAALRFSPNGQRAAIFRSGLRLEIVDVPTGEPIRALRGHTGIVHDADFSPDGRTLASASADGTLRLWHAATGREICTLADLGYPLRHCRFSRDGRTLVCWSDRQDDGLVDFHVFRVPSSPAQ